MDFNNFLTDIRNADPIQTNRGALGPAEEWITIERLQKFWDYAIDSISNDNLALVFAKGMMIGYIERRLEEQHEG